MDQNTRCPRISIVCERAAYQLSAHSPCASLHSASKHSSASCAENRCAAFMNACLVSWPSKANPSIRVCSHKKAQKAHERERELVKDPLNHKKFLLCLFVARDAVRSASELTEECASARSIPLEQLRKLRAVDSDPASPSFQAHPSRVCLGQPSACGRAGAYQCVRISGA